MQADLIDFFQHVLELKCIKRVGWVTKVGVRKPESVADHSYSMCAISMVLSDILGLETEKIMKMVMLHDLAESVIGDYMPNEVSKRQKREMERKAMNLIMKSVPTRIRQEYKRIWDEYIRGKSNASDFVHLMDKLEMTLQAKEYEKADYPSDLLTQFFEYAKKSSNSDKTFPIVREILNTLKPYP
jgi:putative hydrolase of HD superfamily